MAKNPTERYAAARKILREVRPLRFWNSYKTGTKTLKVYYISLDRRELKVYKEAHREISKLADYVREGSRGGWIYGFRGVA